jgi:hypothetical protein
VFSEASDVQAGSVSSLDTKEPSREQNLLIKGISVRIDRSSDRFEYRNGLWAIRTLNPLNDTIVDGTPIQDSCDVGPGTLILIGRTQVRIDDT